MFRKALFWCHLTAGSIAAAIILIMCVTGVLLMYERQMLAWADRHFRSTPQSDGTPRVSPTALLAQLHETQNALPTTLTLYSRRDAPAAALFAGRVVYLDVYSGQILGESAKGIRSFFRTVTDWHRWLAMQGPNRPVGRAVTGAANLAFLFLVLSGMYLWLPRRWSWPGVRSVLFYRSGLTAKARDFNWHNVTGIWCSVPLVLIVLGALVISYPWATNLVYRLTGSDPPAAAAQVAPPATAKPRAAGETPASPFANLDDAWARAERQVSGWQSISLRVPASPRAPFDFIIAESHRGRPDKRHTLTVDRATGAIIKTESFADFNTGRKVRSWLRFIHTGEALGVAGQTVAGIASAGGAFLVWTGVSLAWRRFRSWQDRKRQAQIASVAR
jgi:uncharacterized iron-regulated membrane protein